MAYFAHIRLSRPIGYHQVPGSLGVFGAPADREPIGIAHCTNWGDDGPALWQLTVGGRRLAGRWAIVDREFRPVE